MYAKKAIKIEKTPSFFTRAAATGNFIKKWIYKEEGWLFFRLQLAQKLDVNTVNISQTFALARKSEEKVLTNAAYRGIICNKKSVDREEVDQKARAENRRLVQDGGGVG